MGDWDPFADPADDEPVVTPASRAAPASGAGGGPSVPEREPEDINAALASLDKEEETKEKRKWTREAFALLLDELFRIDDSDTKALEAALKPVCQACADDGGLSIPAWQRAVPIMLDLVKKEGPQRPNLFGLMTDAQLGLYAKDRRDMSDYHVDYPPDLKANGVVIFLFAWGGGNVGDMDDMVHLYRSMSDRCVIVRLQCNMKASFGLRRQCAFAIKMATAAWARTPKDAKRRLFVHLFSNGGFMTWTELLQCWAALSASADGHPDLEVPLPPMADVLCGIILDSACDSNIAIGPCLQSLVQSMASFIHQVVASDHDDSEAGRKAAELQARKVVNVLISDASPVKAHLSKKPEKFVTRQSCVDAHIVHRLEPPVNMQFICSQDDNIIRYEAIEDYIKQVIKRESRVGLPHPRRLVFEKSKHCLHKVVHREEYERCVRLFAGNCIAA